MSQQVPSKNAADEAGGMAGALRAVLRKHMQGVDGQLPAVVVAYDAQANVATVRPMIAIVGTSGEVVQRPQVARVPCLALGAGGFVLRLPIKPGDQGWIEASDRDISLYLQAQGPSRPNTSRMHTFSDGRFIPDSFARAVIAGEDLDAMTLQSYDGSVRIALDAEGIRVYAPQTTIDSPVTFKQPVVFEDTTDFEGNMTGTGGLVVNGIVYETHVHSDVVAGGDNTGEPVA